MADDRQTRVSESLSRLPSALSIPISAALGLSREGPILQVYRFVDAVDFVLRFVVAHGAGVADRASTPIRLRLPDHPTIQDWISAAYRLRNADRDGALAQWDGLPVLTAILAAIEDECRNATEHAGLGRLSFRELRNWIFHGGGVGLTRSASEVLVGQLVPIMENITVALGSWGPAAHEPDLVWPVFREETCPEVFIRIDHDQARYAPMGGEALLALGGQGEIAAYRRRLGEEPERLRDFWAVVLERSTHLVGREQEVNSIVEQLRMTQRRPWWWLFAAMGRGKSTVMAAVAHRLSQSSEHSHSVSHPVSAVIAHFFRGGDARNNVAAFVTLAAHQLAPHQQLPEDPTQQERALRQLLRQHQPFVVCDGLDELERVETGGTQRLFSFAQAGGRWVFASRDVPEVRKVLAAARTLWPNGLPAMTNDDLKTVLLSSDLPGVRDAMVAATESARIADPSSNGWIDLVVSRCEGSPLYLELLLSQLASHGTVAGVRAAIDAMIAAPSSIPRGLDALYRSLVTEFGTGDLAALATPSLCLLAQAREPLAASALADLLLFDDVPPGNEEHAATVGLIEQLLRRFGPVLTSEKDSQRRRGVRIDHDSFRTFLARDSGHARTWARAMRIWARASESPEQFPNVSPHLLRHGIAYLVDADRVPAAARLLQTIEWHYRRLEILELEGVEQTLDDLSKIEMRVTESDAGDFAAWRMFFGRHAHLMRRGNAEWGPHKIFHQLVCDYPPSSTAAKTADALSTQIGEPPLRLLPGAVRPTQPPSLRFTLDREHISDGPSEVLQLRKGWLVAWASQGTVQVARPDGREVSRFALERIDSSSVHVTSDDRLVFLGATGDAELWDPGTGHLVERFENAAAAPPVRPESAGGTLPVDCEFDENDEPQPGPLARIADFLHAGELEGALKLMDGGVTTWSIEDRAVRVWDLSTYDEPPGDWVREIVDLGNGLVLSRFSGSEFQAWSAKTGRKVVLEAHDHWPAPSQTGAGRNLQWPFKVNLDVDRVINSDTKGISVVSRSTGAVLARFEGHQLIPTGALPIRGGAAVVSWAFHEALCAWDSATGALLSTFALHQDTVFGALETADGRIVSWSRDGTFWVWDLERRHPSVAAFHPTVDTRLVVHPCSDRLVASGAWSCPLFMKLLPISARADFLSSANGPIGQI